MGGHHEAEDTAGDSGSGDACADHTDAGTTGTDNARRENSDAGHTGTRSDDASSGGNARAEAGLMRRIGAKRAKITPSF